MISVEVRFVIEQFIGCTFTREQHDRSEKQDCGWNQNEDEKKESPRCLSAPSIKNPPRTDEQDEKVHDPRRRGPNRDVDANALEAFRQHRTRAASFPNAKTIEIRIAR